MKARIYVRVGKRSHPVYREGSGDSRYKVDASHRHDQRPLEQNGTPLKTMHFAVDFEVPDALFVDPMIPVVEVRVQPDGTFRDEPVVVQVPVDLPQPDTESPMVTQS